MISSKKKEFIVEYRPSSIRAARVSSLKAPIVVEELVEIPVSSDVQVADEVRKFAGAKANGYMMSYCSVFPDNRVVRQVMVDTQKGNETDFVFDILKTETAVEPDDIVAYCLTPDVGGEIAPDECNKKNLLICGVPKADIVQLQDDLIEKAIYPNRLELGSVGRIGLLKDVLTWSEINQPILMLEIERNCSNAMIIGPKGIEMSRKIESGADDIAAALQHEMSLKDVAAAEKLLSSKDFDFGPMATKILRRLLRELQSSIGFFEVQTGQSVSRIHCVFGQDPDSWFQNSIGELLNLETLSFDLKAWLKSKDVTFADEEVVKKVDMSWLSILSLVCNYEGKEDAA